MNISELVPSDKRPKIGKIYPNKIFVLFMASGNITVISGSGALDQTYSSWEEFTKRWVPRPESFEEDFEPVDEVLADTIIQKYPSAKKIYWAEM